MATIKVIDIIKLEKMLKALKNSPTPSLALRRSTAIGSYIIQNTSEADRYMAPRTDVYLRHVLLAERDEVMRSVLQRFSKEAFKSC